MNLSNLSYKQWFGVSLILAIFFAAAVYVLEPDPGDAKAITMGQIAFEDMIKKIPAGTVELQHLVLHPPTDHGEWLTGEEVRTVRKYGQQVVEYITFKLNIGLPHSSPAARLHSGKVVTPHLLVEVDDHNPMPLKTYLEKLQQVEPKVTFIYKYAWWEWQFRVTKSPYQITWHNLPVCTIGPIWISVRVMGWFFGTILAFGFVFPCLSNLVTFGRVFRPDGTEKAKPARPYRKPAAKPAPVATRGMTQADLAQLEKLQAAMEAKLKATPSDRPAGPPVPDAPKPAPAIRPMLSGEPAAEVPVAPVDEKPKEFAGEFYPVAKPATQKKD